MNNQKFYLDCKRSTVKMFSINKSNLTYIMGYNSCSHGNTDFTIVFKDNTQVVVSNDMVHSLSDFIGAICVLIQV